MAISHKRYKFFAPKASTSRRPWRRLASGYGLRLLSVAIAAVISVQYDGASGVGAGAFRERYPQAGVARAPNTSEHFTERKWIAKRCRYEYCAVGVS
jgi:hypothetical protein